MAYLGDISPFKQIAPRVTRPTSTLDERYQRQLSAVQNFDFSLQNPYENMQNPFEDMTVNTRAAELQQEALGQQQADILQGLQGAAGGSGAAALATALSRQAAKSQAQIAADLGQQEQTIQMKKLSAEQEIQQKKLETDFAIEKREQDLTYQRLETMLGLTMEEKAARDRRRQQEEAERAALFGGIGSFVGGIAGFAIGGPLGASIGSNLGGALGASY